MSQILNIIKNIKIQQRLAVFGVVLLLFVATLLAVFVNTTIKTKSELEYIKNQHLEKITTLSNITRQIDLLALNNHLHIEKQTGIVKLQSENFTKTEEVNEIIDSYQEKIQTIEQAVLFDKFLIQFQDYQNVIQEVFNNIKNENYNKANVLLTNKEIAAYETMQETLLEIRKQNHNQFVEKYNKINKKLTNNIIKTFLVSLLALLILVALFAFLFLDLKNNYLKINKKLLQLSLGKVSDKKLDENKTEIGILGKSINKIDRNIQRIETFSSYIAQENYDFDFKIENDNDRIGISLQNLKKNLQKAKKEQELRKKEDEIKSWAREGIAKFGDIMRQASGDIQLLADEIIKNIVKYLDAKIGGLFIYNTDNENDPHLFLLSAFAYDRKKFLSKRIELGDGLIGTAAIDKTTIFLKDIPEGYMEIESGLGDATPKNLLIVPLKTERGLLGVLELASFKNIEKHEREFVEELASTIASTLETVKINARTIQLLKESEKKSQDLTSRENELRTTMQQVQMAQEESERRAAEMASIVSAVDQTLLKLEIDTTGRVISANQRYLRTFGYLQEEILTKQISDLLPGKEQDDHEEILDELKDGQTHRGTYKFKTDTGKNVWLLAQFAPIMGTQNNLIRILYLAIDITEQKQIEERNSKLLGESVNKAEELMKAHSAVKRNEIEMQGIMSAIDQTLMKAEYSYEGNLLSANQKHITTMGYDFKATKGKNIKSFIPADEEEEFNRIWTRVQNGEMQQITVKRKSQSTGRDLWLLNQYTPVKDDKNQILKVLYLAIDITEQKEIELSNQKLLNDAKEKEEILLKNQRDMRRNEIEMQGILTAIDQTMMKAEYSPEGNLVSANKKHIETMGYDFEATVGKNIKSFIPKEEELQFYAIWEKVKIGQMQQVVVKRKNSAGEEIWLLNQYTPIVNRKGEVVKVLYLAQDITEQKRIEERNTKLLDDAREKEEIMARNQQKMRLNEIEMQGIMSAIDQTLMKAEYAPDGTLIEANKKHQQTFGYDPEKTFGKNIKSFIPKDEEKDFNEAWEKVLQGEMQQITVRREDKNGKSIWLLNQYTPIKNAKGEIQKILYMANDITEQKEAELKNQKILQESLENEKKLIEQQKKMQASEREMNAIISAVDQTLMKAEYSVGGRLLTANQKHIEIMGYDFATTRGSDIITFIPEDEIEEFMEMWEKVKAGEAQQLTVKRTNRKTGQTIWLLNQYTPVRNEDDKVFKILYIAIDITKQKEIEEELKIQEESMRLNMEELFAVQMELEEKLEKYETENEELTEKFDTEIDKKYDQWLKNLD